MPRVQGCLFAISLIFALALVLAPASQAGELPVLQAQQARLDWQKSIQESGLTQRLVSEQRARVEWRRPVFLTQLHWSQPEEWVRIWIHAVDQPPLLMIPDIEAKVFLSPLLVNAIEIEFLSTPSRIVEADELLIWVRSPPRMESLSPEANTHAGATTRSTANPRVGSSANPLRSAIHGDAVTTINPEVYKMGIVRTSAFVNVEELNAPLPGAESTASAEIPPVSIVPGLESRPRQPCSHSQAMQSQTLY